MLCDSGGPSPPATCPATLDAFSRNFDSLLEDVAAALARDPGDERVAVMGYYNPWSGRPGQEARASGADATLLGSDGRLVAPACGSA